MECNHDLQRNLNAITIHSAGSFPPTSTCMLRTIPSDTESCNQNADTNHLNPSTWPLISTQARSLLCAYPPPSSLERVPLQIKLISCGAMEKREKIRRAHRSRASRHDGLVCFIRVASRESEALHGATATRRRSLGSEESSNFTTTYGEGHQICLQRMITYSPVHRSRNGRSCAADGPPPPYHGRDTPGEKVPSLWRHNVNGGCQENLQSIYTLRIEVGKMTRIITTTA